MVNKKRSFVLIITIIIIVFLDQLTKYLVKNDILNINYITNSGSLFGMFQNSALLLSWLSMIVLGGFLFYYDKIQKSKLIVKLGSGLVIGGVIGNLIDRLAYGGVIDFIDLGWWPSFNIADSALCIGIGLLFIYFLFENKFKK